MERAYDDAKYGRYSRRPYIDIVIPSLTDPSVAPPGKHVMSCFVQYAPYNLKEGSWDEKREEFGDTVIDTIAEHAPNIRELILHRQVLTPLDLEREFGLSEGNIFQGELTLEQLFFLRPAPGWAQYRTPIRNLVHVRFGDASGRRNHGAHQGETARCKFSRTRSSLEMPRYDVIIIGAGHNGLVAAAYLAKAGLKTLVLERRAMVGGAAVTEEIHPGFRCSTLAHTAAPIFGSIVKELDLVPSRPRTNRARGACTGAWRRIVRSASTTTRRAQFANWKEPRRQTLRAILSLNKVSRASAKCWRRFYPSRRRR
jgi:phytoene dehydrogenase-like protein